MSDRIIVDDGDRKLFNLKPGREVETPSDDFIGEGLVGEVIDAIKDEEVELGEIERFPPHVGKTVGWAHPKALLAFYENEYGELVKDEEVISYADDEERVEREAEALYRMGIDGHQRFTYAVDSYLLSRSKERDLPVVKYIFDNILPFQNPENTEQSNGGENNMSGNDNEGPGDDLSPNFDNISFEDYDDPREFVRDIGERSVQVVDHVGDVVPEEDQEFVEDLRGYLTDLTDEAERNMEALEADRENRALEIGSTLMVVTESLYNVANQYGELSEDLYNALEEHGGIREPDLWGSILDQGHRDRLIDNARDIPGIDDDHDFGLPDGFHNETPIYPTDEEVQQYLEEAETNDAVGYVEAVRNAISDKVDRYRLPFDS